ncbi:MAG TPA: 50S ribosomal protein L20 [Candidatus Cryosericum sp.]|jgi:large subunit ribosomal protein L20
MSRVKGGSSIRRRHKKILKLSKGYVGARSIRYRAANEAVHQAERHAYFNRKEKKREYRALWIVRINALCRSNGITYSQFVGSLKKAGVKLDRKVLADMAVHDKETFVTLVAEAKKQLTA